MIQTHMLWIGTHLSNIELLSINSFLKNNYIVNLWTYEYIDNIPSGVIIHNASEIVPEDQIFKTRGSVAPFSDLFRLKLLSKHGGLWADTDAVALKDASELPNTPFLVTEDIWAGSWRRDKPWTVTNCIINNPQPETGNLIDVVKNFAVNFPRDKIAWSTIGPDALHNIADIYPRHGFVIQDPRFANSIPAGEITQALFNPGIINPQAHFLHLYNDMWKRQNINKNTLPPPNSILADLFKQYL